MNVAELLNGKYIGYIAIVRQGKYKPCIGKVLYMSDDEDGVVSFVASKPNTDSAEEALSILEAESDVLTKIYKIPVKSDVMGFWISHLESLK